MMSIKLVLLGMLYTGADITSIDLDKYSKIVVLLGMNYSKDY